VLLKAAGLYTFPNTLSEVPQGALLTADNAVIDRNGVVQSRRGFQQYGTTFGTGADIASQLMTYKKTVLMQYDDTVQYDSDGNGTWNAFSGSFPQAQAGLRTKYIEANGNFYFTSANGVQCISAQTSADFTTAADYIRPAGGIQALDLSGAVDYSGGGWFIYPTSAPGQSKVAYRMTWGFYDANKDFVEGVPSSRLVMTNYSETDSATVNLTFQIPSQILDLAPNNTQFFYTIYRTAVVQTSTGVTLAQLDPGDEEYQVIQDYPSSAELSAGTITVNDPTPESFRANGALLYTNPVSGSGILQSNYPPPFALDINLYQNTVFYANTATIQQLNLALLSTENLTSGVSTVTVGGETYIFVGSPEIQTFKFDTQANTTDGGYFLINSSSNARQYFVWFSKSGAPLIQDITFPNVATMNPGNYFLIYSANSATTYTVWFDKTGSDTPPTIIGTGLRVPIAGLTTADDVANAVVTAAASNTDFSVVLAGPSGEIQVTNLANGITPLATNGNIPSGFIVTSVQAGVDPTPQPSGNDTTGRLPIEVPIQTSVTAADVASAANIAINDVDDFFSIIDIADDGTGATIKVTNADNGVTTAASNSAIVPVGGDFTIGLVQIGTGQTAVGYGFTVSAVNATVGATYTNNGHTFTILNTLTNSDSPQQILLATGIGAPTATGILTKTSGSGDATITYTAETNITEVLLGNNISPAISIDETARSLVAGINANPTSTVEAFYTSGPTDLPGLFLLQAKTISSSAFSITANSTITGNEFSPSIPTSGTSVISTNSVQVNAIFYSKYQQPEAVPLVNYFLVGPKDKAILRILPIRTGLMIFKEDGIYQLTGTNGQFVISPFDSSALILAPDSAQILNNQIYMLSTQGVVTVTDTGVSVISRPIENTLQQITTPNYDYVSNTFGVSYEADRAYLLWTVTNTDDTVPTQCFRYNTFTNAWTRWPISKNCGVVLINQNVLYLGPCDENFIEQERKNINRTDYADRTYPLLLNANPIVNSTTITLSSTAQVDIGDVLVQTQYLTIYKFNQLLQMLDSDPNTTFKFYYVTYMASNGSDLRSLLNSLATQMDSDSGLNESNFFSSMSGTNTFIAVQSDYNVIVNLLNTTSSAAFKNYPSSTGFYTFEMIVTDLIQNTSNVTVQYIAPVVMGAITLYKGISTDITWSPQTFGDPSISKHVSEGTFLFENTSFFSATVSYASDLSPSFEEVNFMESGIGDWGSFVWSQQTWGGGGTSVPLRTYIPRNKQYCRFILPNFSHVNAREEFALFGTSLTFKPIGERAYRS
jgi:hypothetical protein